VTVARISDVHVTFPTRLGDVHALRGVSLDIARGEIVAVVGESGSGKTMLALSLLGLLPGSPKPRVDGSVTVAGVDMLGGTTREERETRRRRLGAVFQDPLTSLNPTMRIGDQLRERRISSQEAVANLRAAGIPDPERRFRQFPHELSGGLRQRAMIAMAIGVEAPEPGAPNEVSAGGVVTDPAGRPHLIVADEPTTALDVSVQAQVVLLFDQIRREFGCSVVFVTHDLGVAASIADRIAVFYAGRLREIGPTAEILAQPRHPYTRDLLGARLSIGAVEATSIAGDPPDPRTIHTGCAYRSRCANAQDDCALSHPPLVPRAASPVLGQLACFHPVEPGTERPAQAQEHVVAAAAAHRDPVLELRGVSKTFTIREGSLGLSRRPLHAVDDVSLIVPRGGAVALVGESGCGKTTTLRIATGLIAPDSGSLVLPADVARPQLVFQDAGSSLTPWLRIGTQLDERLQRRGVPRGRRNARIDELLGLVGLDARAASAKPRDLSGGQRQRAAIARALASEPAILVCDEPVSALDASLVIRVLELLESLRSRLGIALLVVTHDLAVARRIADDIAVMYRGRIVEQGPVDDVFARPAHPYTRGLIAAIPTTEAGRLAPTLAGEPPAATGRIPGCSFASRCPFVQDRCRLEPPPLYDISATRRSACHFHADVLAAS
jgi:peptide/nickel transport system ATP-binding protein